MISREEIEHLAALARIELKEGEVESLQKDVSDILGYVGHISALEGGVAAGVVPAHHNVLRNDNVRAEGDPLADTEGLVRAAFPTQKDGYNVVRKIIQKDE